ncbi:hypothetical protein CVT25_000640, partial [Psilocybe cyanescens]
IICTIIAPTPLLAASFIIFGEVIKILSPKYSHLHLNVILLVVQGVGGGLVVSSDSPDSANMVNALTSQNLQGAHIMLSGIVFQLGNPLCASDVLDGAMIVLAIYTINIFHPGMLLSEKFVEKGAEMKRLETQ